MRKADYGTRVVPIVRSMTTENAATEVNSYKIEFHGYRLCTREGSNTDPEKDRWIESPVSLDLAPTEFAHKKFIAATLRMTLIQTRIENLIGKNWMI